MEIDIDEFSAAISRVGHVFDVSHIPVGIGISGDRPDRGDLNEWWTGRSIPVSRSGIRNALEILNVPYTQSLLTKCFGLSLSDQYWVNPTDNPLEWGEINFFDNPFSEDVGDALFGKDTEGAEINLISPDNTSDGWLKKRWKIIDGKRCLIKGGSDPAQQEPLNEALATAVMRRLDISHVPYTVMWDDDMPYSVCENFITPRTELVNAWRILQTQKKDNNTSLYKHFVDCCNNLGIPGAVENIDRMLALDFIIANEDRHYNNFGAVRNAETLEWIGFAPIYDCGTSLWYNKFTNAIRTNSATNSKPFRSSHDDQIKLVNDFSWLNITALSDIADEFDSILAKSRIIDDPRRAALCRALSGRVALLDKYIHSQK